MCLFRASASALAMVVALAATPLSAQVVPDRETNAKPQNGAATDSIGADIVVTARKRSETLIDVPVAVSVVTPADLNRNLATDLSKIGETTPTVIVGAYKSNGGGSIAIRGISSPANQAGFEQAVSVAIDGVQTSDGRIAQLGFFDVGQVEILKGPQALFFGKNSPAGVISLKTSDPASRLSVEARTSYEFVGDELTTDAAISAPIAPNLGARLAVRYRHLAGWLRNTARPIANPFNTAVGAPAGASQLPGASDPRPGEQDLLARFTLKGELAPNLTARVKLFGARSKDSGPGVATQNIGPCSGPFPRMYGIADPNADCVADNRTTIGDLPDAIARTMLGGQNGGAPYGRLHAYTAALELNWDTGAGSLNALTGYNFIRYKFLSGLDQTSYSQLAFFNDQSNEAFSQELRYSSKFDGPLNLVLGAYFQKTTLEDHNDTKLRDSNYNPASGRFVTYEDLGRQHGSTTSVFGQALFDLAPKLQLAGGARWTHEKKRFDKRNLYGLGTFNTLTTLYPGSDEVGVLKGRFKDSNLSPEVTLTWHPEANRTVYAAYKTGFKSGGFGVTNPLQTSTRIGDVDFDSETASGFEVGAKGLFLHNHLRAGITAFAYQFKNLQVNTYDASRLAYTINNAGAVRQRGVEAEANYRVYNALTLHGAVAYVRNRFRDFVGQCYGFTIPARTAQSAVALPPNCSFRFPGTTNLTLQQDFNGRAPARSPDWAGNAGFEYEVPVGVYRLGLTGDGFYSDGYYAAETMAPSTYQKAFWRFNASIRVATQDDRYSLALVGRNLTNKYYLLYAADRTGGTSVPLTIGEQRGVVARGREVALQASAKF